jgi:CheY-like chemotaxis protein
MSGFFRRPTVLLVDDDPVVGRTVPRLLAAHADTETVSTREDALKALGERAFDVVICDFDLRVGDGFEVLSEVQRSHPNTLRILFSARRPAGLQARLEGGVVHHFLTKPASRDELLAALRAPAPAPIPMA